MELVLSDVLPISKIRYRGFSMQVDIVPSKCVQLNINLSPYGLQTTRGGRPLIIHFNDSSVYIDQVWSVYADCSLCMTYDCITFSVWYHMPIPSEVSSRQMQTRWFNYLVKSQPKLASLLIHYNSSHRNHSSEAHITPRWWLCYLIASFPIIGLFGMLV